MTHYIIGAGLAAAALLSGCAASSSAPDQSANLAGSTWTLATFQLADGAALRPARPDQYRLSFQPDGRLLAQVDCNRGNASWQATPTKQGGSLHVGPLALTRMMCPPDVVGQRLPADLEAVQSYRIIAGRLQLELAGNAGSYTWERAQP